MKKLLLLSFCLAALNSQAQQIGFVEYATGFTSAIGIEHPPSDPRLFVVQQGGLIRVVNTNGTVNTTPFLNVTSLTTGSGERGLLGLAFHPNYATNGFFFINYTNLQGHTVIARYQVSTTDPNVANPTATILMTINQPAVNHNGGSLRFGSDGYLYIGMGDGGGAGDTSGYAQNMSLTHPQVSGNPSRIYLGKMLRIDVDTTAPGLNYGFPATNPFVAQAGKQEIWAIGLRNPWKFSFNRLNGDLWIADVGQDAIEEINKVLNPAATPASNMGLNFGWNCYEGNGGFSGAPSGCIAYANTVAPAGQYPQQLGRCSITGGYLYTGTAYPNLQNKYVFGDYCTGEVGVLNAAGTITWSYDAPSAITTFGEDMNGELFVMNAGSLKRIVDTLGNDEFTQNGFSIYPNPAFETVFIKSTNDTRAASIELFDLSGKLLFSQNVEASPENSISVANFSTGLYVLSVATQDGRKFNTKLAVH